MATDLAIHIDTLRVCNSHEHLCKEVEWIENGPVDVLTDLLSWYPSADLVAAGASAAAVARIGQVDKFDLPTRWNGIAEAWQAIQWTGYGEAVRLQAKHVYGIEEITPQSLATAQPKLLALRKPGQRLKILSEWAQLDHVQVDDFCWPCLPDASGPDFFLYDIRWSSFCCGEIDVAALAGETGITVTSLASLREALGALVGKYGPCAIALKSQHAYNRTLQWVGRIDAEAERALRTILTTPAQDVDAATKLCLGDWCWERGVELAIQHNLPFKLHTGYLAGNGYMRLATINPTHLCDLLMSYPEARFVLMHIGYPFDKEMIALAKHYANVWVDLCWAWSVDPHSGMDFVRRFIHAVPINKLLAFGGDTRYPTASYAYTLQMRKWLTKTLQAEVDDGELTEREAITVASRILRENQFSCFDVAGRRATIRKLLAS